MRVIVPLVVILTTLVSITLLASMAMDYANPDIGRGLHPGAAVIFAAAMAALALHSIHTFNRIKE